MSVVIFCGPTLCAAEARREIECVVHPPAARGDVLSAALERPAAIGIVDGYFDRVPAVWHKEILWAISQGIAVFGAASMGALRAAELSDFGMVGVGAVFEQFRTGALTDDDEVAILHADAELGFRPASEAMVNIRVTLRAAASAGVISEAVRARLEQIAKDLLYPDRSYPMLLTLAEKADLPRAEVAELARWLPSGAINQKREDALLMLREMAAVGQAGRKRREVTFRLSETDAWHALRGDVERRIALSGGGTRLDVDALEPLEEELMLAGTAGPARNGAWARALCHERAERLGLRLDPRAVTPVVEEFRRERGLLSAEQFAAWIAANRLGEEELDRFFEREAVVRAARRGIARFACDYLTDELRASGEYASLLERAEAKRRLLSASGLDSAGSENVELSDAELWHWYFVEQRGGDMPVDVRAFAAQHGLTKQGFRNAVVREYLFVTNRGAP